jgi:sterol desaturase/sphingolipid hydroxylase (fatty acid hydroxylase superfamily)
LLYTLTVSTQVEANKEIIFTYDVKFEVVLSSNCSTFPMLFCKFQIVGSVLYCEAYIFRPSFLFICYVKQESGIEWASRWDTYTLVTNDHWFSVVNSLMVVVFLSGSIVMIMLRTLYRDISKYNKLESQEVTQEETGWKLIHGDVFRLPANTDLLCMCVGTGVQLYGIILFTLLFSILGLVSSSNQGGLITTMLLLWVLMGLFAGYFTACLHKISGARNGRRSPSRRP